MKKYFLPLVAILLLIFNSCKKDIDYLGLLSNVEVGSPTTERIDDKIKVTWTVPEYEHLAGFVITDSLTHEVVTITDATVGECLLNFEPGTHDIMIQVKDSQGNLSTGKTVQFVLSYLTLTGEMNVTDLVAVVEEGNIVLTWTAPDYDYHEGYKIVDGLAELEEATEDNTPSFSFPRVSGVHTITVFVRDTEGNFSSGTTVELAVDTEVDIYVLVKGNGVYDVFMNGEPMDMFSNTTGMTMRDMVVNGTDVYIVGYYGSPKQPCYWKNGVVVDLPDTDGANTYATSAFYANDKLYVGGYESNTGYVVLWEDGVLNKLSSGGVVVNMGTNSLFVNGDDVYATAYETSSGSTAKYWKNGTMNEIQGAAMPTDIFVDGDNVYTAYAGTSYQKNEEVIEVPFTEGSSTQRLRNLVAKGDNVYAVGVEKIDGNYTIRSWKNGVKTDITSSSHYAGNSPHLAVVDDYMYVAGYVKDKSIDNQKYIAKLWKDGEVLYTFTDGTADGYAYIVYLEPKQYN